MAAAGVCVTLSVFPGRVSRHWIGIASGRAAVRDDDEDKEGARETTCD